MAHHSTGLQVIAGNRNRREATQVNRATIEDFGGLDFYEAELRSSARLISANPLPDQRRTAELRDQYWFLSKLRRAALVWADEVGPAQRARLLRAADERHKPPFMPTAKHIASMIAGEEVTNEACTAFWDELTGLQIAPDTDVEWFFVAAALHWSQL
jgi:hypothetical protein